MVIRCFGCQRRGLRAACKLGSFDMHSTLSYQPPRGGARVPSLFQPFHPPVRPPATADFNGCLYSTVTYGSPALSQGKSSSPLFLLANSMISMADLSSKFKMSKIIRMLPMWSVA
jgi:hypothetical protein